MPLINIHQFIFSLLLVSIYSLSAALAKANSLESFINSICLSRFKQEMNEAKITAPEGMAAYSCKCFLKEVEEGSKLDTAKSSCKEKASKKFNL